DIARAARIPAGELRTRTDGLVRRAGASNAAHLIGLAHTHGILSGEATTTPATTALADTAADRDGRATWAYEMRPIVTAADREAAAALVQDRGLWLARRGHDAPTLHIAAFRDHRTEAVGLY